MCIRDRYHLLKSKKPFALNFYILSGTFVLLASGTVTLLLSISADFLQLFGFQEHYSRPWDIPLVPLQIGVLLEIVLFSVGLSFKSQLSLKNKNRLLARNEALQKEANQKLVLELALEKEAKEKVSLTELLRHSELKTLRAQLKPHFIYNCLFAVLNFIEKKDTKNAATYLKKFTSALQSILQLSEQSAISLKEELKIIENYIKLQQMRFPNEFKFTLKKPPTIKLENIFLPPLISQPFVENAIEYGLLRKNETPHLIITILLAKKVIKYQIEDNGIGIVNQPKKEGQNGMGIKISRERIFLFNQKHQTNLQLVIKDKKEAKNSSTGTLVEIIIPQ